MDTTPSSNDSTTTTATASQAAGQLKATLTSADANVTQGIQGLGLVHQARLSQATRTAAALKAQYGADDPRVKAAEAAVTATQTNIGRISMVSQQLAAPAVQVASTGWALQGHVLDAQLQPVAKYTVFLVDANKEFLKQYGFSYTDATGYFLLNYSGVSGQARAAATTTTQLFIAVVNADANPVYLSSTPFQPVLGTATFQNIVLPAGGTLGDPTQPIRAVAFPGRDAKG